MLSVGPFAEGDSFGELLGALARKGTVVFLEPSQFDARAVWDTVRRESVTRLVIGGDVQARLLLAALGSRPAETFSALETIASTGAPLGSDVAAALATALPNVTVLGATEPVPTSSGPGTATVLPSDVERRLKKHASIEDCVVLGISDPRIGKLVVGLVEVVDNHYLDAPELAAWCRAHLPASLTPTRFVIVDHIERTESGQVDEAALRSLAVERLVEGR